MKICQLLIIAAIVLIALKQKNGLRDTLLLLAFFFSFCLINKEGLSEEDDDDDDSEIPEVIISIPPSPADGPVIFSGPPSVQWTYTGPLGDDGTTMTVKKQSRTPGLSCSHLVPECFSSKVPARVWWGLVVVFFLSVVIIIFAIRLDRNYAGAKLHVASHYDMNTSFAVRDVGGFRGADARDWGKLSPTGGMARRLVVGVFIIICIIIAGLFVYSWTLSEDANGCIKDTWLNRFLTRNLIMEHEERTPGTVRLRDQPTPTPTPSPTPSPTPTPSGNGKSCEDCINEAAETGWQNLCLMDEKICSANIQLLCIEDDPSSPMKWCGSPPQNVGGVYSGEDEPQNIDDVFICCDNSDSCACSDINNYAEQCRNLSLNGDDGDDDIWNKTGKLNVGGDKFSPEETAEKSYLEKCCAPVVKCAEASFSCAPGSTPKEEATCSYSPCSQEDFQSFTPSPSPPTSTTCCNVD